MFAVWVKHLTASNLTVDAQQDLRIFSTVLNNQIRELLDVLSGLPWLWIHIIEYRSEHAIQVQILSGSGDGLGIASQLRHSLVGVAPSTGCSFHPTHCISSPCLRASTLSDKSRPHRNPQVPPCDSLDHPALRRVQRGLTKISSSSSSPRLTSTPPPRCPVIIVFQPMWSTNLPPHWHVPRFGCLPVA